MKKLMMMMIMFVIITCLMGCRNSICGIDLDNLFEDHRNEQVQSQSSNVSTEEHHISGSSTSKIRIPDISGASISFLR